MKKWIFYLKTIFLITLLYTLNAKKIHSSFIPEKKYNVYEQMISLLTYQIDQTRMPTKAPVEITKHIYLTSLYGYRIHPITHEIKKHDGIDLSGKLNTPIYSTGYGKVIDIKYSTTGYGNVIKIKHNDSIETVYAHLNSIDVKIGDIVQQHQKIGAMGKSGLATGVHLHYEVRLHNKAQNPLNYFSPFIDEQLLATK